MARRATSLFLFLFWLFFFVFYFVCFGGFKGQVRWPRRATSLGPKPSLFIILLCIFLFVFVPFLSLLCNTKKLVFPLEKGIFCLFLSVSLCFSLPFFGLPLFQCFFLRFFLCLSLLLVLFSFPSCLSFLLSFASLFLSLSFLFFLLCFCFMKRTTSNSSIPKFSFINIFCFLVSCLLFSLKSLFLIFVFC